MNKSRRNGLNLIDTFPDFEVYWKKYRHASSESQITGWVNEYMSKWPFLHKIQIKQYQSEGVNWKNLTKRRIFPELQNRLPNMRLARTRLHNEIEEVVTTACATLDVRIPIVAVIYVGIGLGAGWATKYRNKPALLFGLENIAEEGWTDVEEIRGLVAHEFAHLAHYFWREKVGKRFMSSPLWQLYCEGFADRLEVSIGSQNNSHRDSTDRGSAWFERNKQWLADQFLAHLKNNRNFKDFFGSWYQLRGHSQTGYVLGSAIVKQLEKDFSFQEIATIDHVSSRMKQGLHAIAGGII
jgi:hypothetical protein